MTELKWKRAFYILLITASVGILIFAILINVNSRNFQKVIESTDDLIDTFCQRDRLLVDLSNSCKEVLEQYDNKTGTLPQTQYLDICEATN